MTVPVCTKLAADLSLRALYLEQWNMARIPNETGLRAALNYAAWIALALMPLFNAWALNQRGEVDEDPRNKKKSAQ